MKSQVLTAVCAAAIAAQCLTAWASRTPNRAPLPDVDQRKAASPKAPVALASPVPSPAPLTPAQGEAFAVLQQRVPGAIVSRDPIVGSPRLITASQGFLTGRNGLGGAVSAEALNAYPQSDPHRVVKAFMDEHSRLFGHDASALDAAEVRRDYVDSHNGLRTVVWEQTLAEVPVFGGLLRGHVTAKEELVRLSSGFVATPAQAAARGAAHWSALLASPALTPEQAIAVAAGDIGDSVAEMSLEARNAPEGAKRKQIFRSPDLKGDTYVELAWLPMDPDTLRLCWKVFFVSKSRGEGFRTLVDAETGGVVIRQNLTFYQGTPPVAVSMSVYTSDSPSPFTPGWPTPSIAQPGTVARTHLTNFIGLSAVGSPRGWVYPATNSVYTTVGNNVDAHADWDDNDDPDTPRPQVPQDTPDFMFPLDLNLAPSSYTNAAIVNLFYWNNFMHDRLYGLGFTEAAGNFQNDNFNRGGLDGDPVMADAQDGYALNDPWGHSNNSNFLPTEDGIPGRMQMFIFDGPLPDRDGDLDAEIICHEYTHGLTGRLIGGGTLEIWNLQTRGLLEGWSDFYPLALLSEPTDDPNACYPMVGYASHMFYDLEENYYYGIRIYPYTTDLNKHPLTFKDIDPLQADPHIGIPTSPLNYNDPTDFYTQGSLWCAALWECRANLVDNLGWDEGNYVALQLVTDGLKLTPPNPNFIEARDAILQADEISYGGANRNELWFGFAKRGLGVNALAPPSDTTVGVVEDFDVPPDVVVSPPDGILEISISPANNATVRGGTATPVFVRVRDGSGVTNATVAGLVNGLTQLAFNNRGTLPDARPNDSTYSGTLNVPSTGTNVTITVTVTAPGKTSATNTVSYYIAIPPANDLFANAIKVKAEGATLAANNRFADPMLESGEPAHGGSSAATLSVWWSWTPTSNSRVLIDTGGTKFNALLGVYTGTSVNNLKQVAAAQTQPQDRLAYVQFDAKRSTNYFIAVASAGTNSSGQITLRIAPGAAPDLTAPVVNISSPVSGLIVVSNSAEVVAVAVDPGPISSGIDRLSFVVKPITARANIFPPLNNNGQSTNRVALTAGRNTVAVTAVDGVGNQSDPAEITVHYRPQPVPNDHFNNASLLEGASGGDIANNAQATLEPGEPKHAANDGGHSVWWRWTAPEDGALLLSTDTSTFDTLLGLYRGTRVDLLHHVASNDDAFDNSRFSKLQQGVRSNQTYYVAVDGFNGSTGVVQLAYSFAPGPLFTIDLQATTGGSVAEHGLGLVDVPAHSSQTLTAVPDSGYEFSGWEGDVVSLVNPLSVQVDENITLKATFRPVLYSDDFETGNLSKLPWVTTGAKPWTVTTAAVSGGKYSARSGAIGNAQTTSLTLTSLCSQGAVAFDVKVSSEEGWDVFRFLYDGVEVLTLSGDLDWSRYSFPVVPGTHTFEWRYSKDNQTAVGLDAAFIDNVAAPLVPPVTAASTPRLSLNRLPQGQYELRLTGQTNQVYILYKTTQTPPDRKASWIPFATNVAYYGEIRIFLDPESLTAPRTFYRAQSR